MKLIVKEHSTSPLVLHGNGTGKSTEVFNKARDFQFTRKVDKLNSQDFTFISWKGGKIPNNEKTLLEKSGDQYGFKVLNLPWNSTGGFWKDSQQKITQTLEVIDRGIVDTEFVFWLDNSDVFFIDSPQKVYEAFTQKFQNYNFIWNAEKNNYPTPNHTKWSGSNVSNKVQELLLDVIEDDNTYPSSFKFMNSGAGFGKTSALKDILKYAHLLIENSRVNDQALLRIAQRKFEDKVAIDRNCDIFLCCWGVESQEIDFVV